MDVLAKSTTLILRGALGLAWLALSPQVVVADSLPELPRVSTFAGSGIAGITDGPSAVARFASPNGIAYDRSGNLFVADTAGQRIRTIDRNGNVRTIAGIGESILFGAAATGGYQDGPAKFARFRGPEAVAVDRAGTVFVADTGNHCVRAIAKGMVTTIAGDPSRVGAADGTKNTASFTNPRSIAVDRSGNVYVADPPNGIRKIAPDGSVTTLSGQYLGAEWKPWAVAVYDDGKTSRFLSVTPRQIGVFDLADMHVIQEVETEQLWYTFPPREGAEFLGPPSAAAMISPTEIVYTDDLLSSVHLVQLGDEMQTRILTAEPLLNAANRGGGFRDGPGGQALMDQPMGIAVAPDGQIAVSDAGNKRIRLLSQFNRRSAARDGNATLPSTPDSSAFRVAIVGNSYVWTNVPWDKSIGGVIESDVDRATSSTKSRKTVRVFHLRKDGARVGPLMAYADGVLSSGMFDTVVLMVPTYGQFTIHDDLVVSSDPGYAQSIESGLKTLQRDLAANGVDLLVVLYPGAFDMPNEMTYRKFFEGVRDPSEVSRHYSEALNAVKNSGAKYLDLWPAFFQHDSGLGAQPLFGAWDHHFTYAGDAIVGHRIAQWLAQKLKSGAKSPAGNRL